MIKSREIIAKAVENPKYTFEKAEGHPEKTRKHRHERRKVKESLNLGDWLESQNPN